MTSVTFTLLSVMIEVREYIDADGESAFAIWFGRLNAQALWKDYKRRKRRER